MEISIQPFTDSNVTVLSGRKWYSRTEPMATILRALAYKADSLHIAIDMTHIPGKTNTIADAISRGDALEIGLRSENRVEVTVDDVVKMLRKGQ